MELTVWVINTVRSRASHELMNIIEMSLATMKKSGGGPKVAWNLMRLQAAGMISCPPVHFYAIRLCWTRCPAGNPKSESGYAAHRVFDICSGSSTGAAQCEFEPLNFVRTLSSCCNAFFHAAQQSTAIGEVLNLTPGFLKVTACLDVLHVSKPKSFWGWVMLLLTWNVSTRLSLRVGDIPPLLEFMQRQFPHPGRSFSGIYVH